MVISRGLRGLEAHVVLASLQSKIPAVILSVYHVCEIRIRRTSDSFLDTVYLGLSISSTPTIDQL
jgi:hypothetical protein